MNTTLHSSKGPRALHIDFALYTEGDQGFKEELILLIIANLHEFKALLDQAIQQNNFDIFSKGVHKMHTTLDMLNDKDLTELVTQLNDITLNNDTRKHERITLFNTLCEDIISSLQNELEASRK